MYDIFKRCDLGEIKRLITTAADIIPDGEWPVTLVGKCGNIEVMKYLITLGFDVAADEHDAVTWASWGEHLDMIKYLVSLGADITIDHNAALRWAIANGNLEITKYLVGQGADITDRGDEIGAISWTVDCVNLEIVKYLVDVGVDITTQDNEAVKQYSSDWRLDIHKYLIDLVLKSMKKHVLLLLLNKKIHKDLVPSLIQIELVEHYELYQRFHSKLSKK